jgi:hypothetical protein
VVHEPALLHIFFTGEVNFLSFYPFVSFGVEKIMQANCMMICLYGMQLLFGGLFCRLSVVGWWWIYILHIVWF